jgi:hypothetical protein
MTKCITIWKGYWKVSDARQHPDWLFVFGDNDIEAGCKGQSIIRAEVNSAGIPTKKYPALNPASFYTDDELENNREKIRTAVDSILERRRYYMVLVLPEDGLGTGLADLPNKAPKTYKSLNEEIERLKKLWVNGKQKQTDR